MWWRILVWLAVGLAGAALVDDQPRNLVGATLLVLSVFLFIDLFVRRRRGA